ncbi:MAG TPA: hypothetical protein VMA36_20920 [Candidatus Limnocylindria bacterium]|jgi:hypothetical protein|nr:hypothetical protein [Candidatus Limnocylindria bacterium]
MLSLLPIVSIVVALATDPSPGPSASPGPSSGPTAPARPTPLTEIGRVRALPACTPIVVHANGAITQALDNDRALAILTHNLRAADYDNFNVVQLNNAINALTKIAADIEKNAISGDGEVKRLREYAAASPDPQRKKELKAFADALGGALYRQKKSAGELMRDIAIVQGRSEAADAREIMAQNNPPPETAAMTTGTEMNRRSMLGGHPDSWTRVMQQIAAQLDDLAPAIGMDEGTAADHSIAATSGC